MINISHKQRTCFVSISLGKLLASIFRELWDKKQHLYQKVQLQILSQWEIKQQIMLKELLFFW